MGFKMLILFSITLLFLTINSYAILDPSEIGSIEGSSLADKLIEQSQGSYIQRGDSRFPATPFESRKLQENKSLVWSPMPNSLAGGRSDNPKEARSISGEQINDQNLLPNVEENAKNSMLNIEENRVAGSWSFELNDTEFRQIALTLFQVEDAIFGSGSIKDGENTFVAAASGNMKGDTLDLDIISIGTIGLYRLATTLSSDAVSGTYKAYSASGQIGTGNVRGIRNLPMP